MQKVDIETLIRDNIQRLSPYQPGEQPTEPNIIKLNTNENPYPPSPYVLEKVRAAIDGRLRLYPPPTATNLREKLATLYGYKPENIIIGNGSDELLAMACRAFVEPCTNINPAHINPRTVVQYFDPSYSLYPVLAHIHGAIANPIPLNNDFSFPSVETLHTLSGWFPDAALTYITTPNAPSGRAYDTRELEYICKNLKGVVILDEAYAEFAEVNAIDFPKKYPHVIVSRTFSKAYCLCFLRIGYFIGNEKLIAALYKIKDSYNVNGIAQIAAEATLEDLEYYHKNILKIRENRDKVRSKLIEWGFEVFPSQTNFLLAKPPHHDAKWWLCQLRRYGILIRWFPSPKVHQYIRITIGTTDQMDFFLDTVKQLI